MLESTSKRNSTSNPTQKTSPTGNHIRGSTADGHRHVLSDIRGALHDIKENVKETLQRDHHNGQDCVKRPQDGKTNPLE
ncbi:hypothetical protein K501DRAFT_186463 [Backusella circina FSU 941]|nr:hypothetical protein K501DRAFT_186463 [Backusella circina FSU 941]